MKTEFGHASGPQQTTFCEGSLDEATLGYILFKDSFLNSGDFFLLFLAPCQAVKLNLLFNLDSRFLPQLQFYRFSISWPRLLPHGDSARPSTVGTQYYNDLIDALVASGIKPVVCAEVSTTADDLQCA